MGGRKWESRLVLVYGSRRRSTEQRPRRRCRRKTSIRAVWKQSKPLDWTYPNLGRTSQTEIPILSCLLLILLLLLLLPLSELYGSEGSSRWGDEVLLLVLFRHCNSTSRPEYLPCMDGSELVRGRYTSECPVAVIAGRASSSRGRSSASGAILLWSGGCSALPAHQHRVSICFAPSGLQLAHHRR